MKDKVVIMADYGGLKEGHLVRFVWDDLEANKDDVGLVLDRCLVPRTLGEGDHENYDPMLIVLTRNKRVCVSVDAVVRLDDG